jgi:hypothetical protein
MEYVKGYFTVERNIVGLTLHQMEAKLGFRPGRLTNGVRILVLQRQPSVGEFVFAGSTRYPDAEGLVGVEQRRSAASTAVPHAWLGQRLVKVAPNLLHTASESYPKAMSPVEQWELLVPLPAEEVRQLDWHQTYWPKR